MPVENIPVELIDDNPFNPRTHYPTKKIDELAESIERIGLQEPPKGRQVDGRYQLAFGSLRKRAWQKLAKKDPEKWATMPVEVQRLSDDDMFAIAIDENIKRTDLKPVEVARGIDAFLNQNPDISEVKLASALGMTQGAVSNMRRVIALPPEILEKLNEDIINFHMARELLIFSGFDNALELMRDAISKLKTGSKNWGEPPTVQGIIRAIAEVASYKFNALEKGGASWRRNAPLFDAKEQGCLECSCKIVVHPTQKDTTYYCTNKDCWEKKQQEHRDKIAAEAKAKMEAEVLQKATAELPRVEQKPTPMELGISLVYVDKSFLEEKVKPSSSTDIIAHTFSKVHNPFLYDGKDWICTSSGLEEYRCYQLVRCEEWKGETRTYSVPQGREYEEYYESLRNDPLGFYHGMVVTYGKSQCVLVGPETTFTEAKAISQEISKPVKTTIKAVLPPSGVRWAEDVPEEECQGCKLDTEDHTVNFSFPTHNRAASDHIAYRKVCLKDYRAVTKKTIIPTIDNQVEEVKQTIPADILSLAREKAGTRAEILDIHDSPSSGLQILKDKYTDILNQLDNPEECLEKCTTGFHYAYRSTDNESQVYSVCTNPKCLAQKKGAKTRAEHAEGLAQKQAEAKAIKEALKIVEDTAQLEAFKPTLKLVILAQFEGHHVTSYYSGTGWKSPYKYVWDEVSSGTADDKRTKEALWELLDKMSESQLAQLVVKMMFYYLSDRGDDIGRYKIKTKPIELFGIDIKDYLQEW